MTEIPRRRLNELEGKLLTLYTLSRLNSCTHLQLISFMHETDLMNYFDLQAALVTLVESGQLICENRKGDDLYYLSPEGYEALELFQNRSALSAMHKIDLAAPPFLERMKREREIKATIHHEGGLEYHVLLEIADEKLPLMKLDLCVPTAGIADRFRAAWEANAQDIYDGILSKLSGGEL